MSGRDCQETPAHPASNPQPVYVANRVEIVSRAADIAAGLRRNGHRFVSGWYAFIDDLGRTDYVLLRINNWLGGDLFAYLGWQPQWSDAGRGWLIPRPLWPDLEQAAINLRISPYDDAPDEMGAR